MEITDESVKACKVNEQDVKPVYPIDNLFWHLPNFTTFGHVTKYIAKLMTDLKWKLNPHKLPDLKSSTGDNRP